VVALADGGLVPQNYLTRFDWRPIASSTVWGVGPVGVGGTTDSNLKNFFTRKLDSTRDERYNDQAGVMPDTVDFTSTTTGLKTNSVLETYYSSTGKLSVAWTIQKTAGSWRGWIRPRWGALRSLYYGAPARLPTSQ
jgi:hypothetical protein